MINAVMYGTILQFLREITGVITQVRIMMAMALEINPTKLMVMILRINIHL